MKNLKVITQNNEYNFTDKLGTSIIKILKNNCINFNFPCGGNGRCGNCKVKVLKGIEMPTKVDKLKLTQNELNENIRLCCCLNLNRDMEIFLKEVELSFLE